MEALVILLLICCPLIIVILLVAFGVTSYNSLVKLKVLVDEAWSGIDVQLKRRFDLIPNIVETVKGYAKHEKEIWGKFAEARNNVAKLQKEAPGELTKARAEAEMGLSGLVSRLFALAESYPELKANDNFLKLQDELSKIEDEIQSSRRYYNGAARDLNTKIQVFPTNIFAKIFGFKVRNFFEAAEGEREAPKVSFEEKSESKTEEVKAE